jgi:hypothetical protein
MSGGSYDYACYKVSQFADDLEVHERKVPEYEADWQVYNKAERRWMTPEESAPVIARVRGLRAWFVEHLRLVSQAMHDIEWVDSGDYGPGDEVDALEKVRAHLEKSVDPPVQVP